MLVWRIARAPYTSLDGEGARRRGARWNSPGRALVYTSRHASLAALELLVHVGPADIPDDLRLFGIEIPDDLEPEALSLTSLPSDWQTMPAPTSTQAIGDAWLATGTSALLVVPSIVMQHERNYLVNPAHPDARRISIASNDPFAFDPRLLGDPGA